MRSFARAAPLWDVLEMKYWRRLTIPNGVCVEDRKRHVGMGECKFVRIYLRGTQEKLERVLLAMVTLIMETAGRHIQEGEN
jgi:hypothetical protein